MNRLQAESTAEKAVYEISGRETLFANLLWNLKNLDENKTVTIIELRVPTDRVSRLTTLRDMYEPDWKFLTPVLQQCNFQRTGSDGSFAIYQTVVRDTFVGSHLVVEPEFPAS
jgi:hypothetical protein